MRVKIMSTAEKRRRCDLALGRARDESRSLGDRIHDAGNAEAGYRDLGEFLLAREAKWLREELGA